MATVIRLKRGGRTHAPYYRVVVVDSRNRAGGRVIEEIGVYQPCARPEPKIELDCAKALGWLKRGARPSDTARKVLSTHGVMAEFAKPSAPPAAEPAAPQPAEQQPAEQQAPGATEG